MDGAENAGEASNKASRDVGSTENIVLVVDGRHVALEVVVGMGEKVTFRDDRSAPPINIIILQTGAHATYP